MDREELISELEGKLDKDSLSLKYDSTVKKKLTFIIAGILMILACSFIAMALGPTNISLTNVLKTVANCFGNFFSDVPDMYKTVIIDTRLPRILMAIIVGASLAVCGCIMQGILRNPLVSPFTLGVSTAAAFGAGLSIVYGATIFGAFYSLKLSLLGYGFTGSSIVSILFAFVFGLISISFVLILANRENTSKSTLVLSGVVISYIFQAGLSFLKYISDDSSLRDITLWTMGNLWSSSWATVLIILPVVILCMIYLEKISIDINTLASGEDVARNLGIDVGTLKRYGLLVCTVLTSTCMAFTGAIGFIGLMAPHICRRLIGNDNRFLVPASATMGAIILLISDTVSRTMFSSDVPVGILIYLIGGAFFVWMVIKKDWRESA